MRRRSVHEGPSLNADPAPVLGAHAGPITHPLKGRHVVETMQCFAEVATFRQRLIAAGTSLFRFREGHASRRRVDVETRDGDVDEVVGG